MVSSSGQLTGASWSPTPLFGNTVCDVQIQECCWTHRWDSCEGWLLPLAKGTRSSNQDPAPGVRRWTARRWVCCSKRQCELHLRVRGPGGGMAYAGDLKSLALTGVRVRLPPRAPGVLRLVGECDVPFWLAAARASSSNVQRTGTSELSSLKEGAFAARLLGDERKVKQSDRSPKATRMGRLRNGRRVPTNETTTAGTGRTLEETSASGRYPRLPGHRRRGGASFAARGRHPRSSVRTLRCRRRAPLLRG